jgi:uncharacterized membrane protein
LDLLKIRSAVAPRCGALPDEASAHLLPTRPRPHHPARRDGRRLLDGAHHDRRILGGTFFAGQIEGWFDELLDRLPFVRLLYSATKDLMNAFVGEQRRFQMPVLVSLSGDGAVRTLGFVTQRSLAQLGMPGDVAVYCPHSYNFSGQLVVVPTSRVQPLDAVSSDVVAFVVSGGVADVPTLRSGTP